MRDELPTSLRPWILGASLLCQLPMLVFLPMPLIAAITLVAVATIASKRTWPMPLRLLGMLGLGLGTLYAFDFRFGRDAASAVLLSMLCLKFSETYHRRDARSVLGFSLFAPFAAFLQSQEAWLMLLTALCIPPWVSALSWLDAAERPADWRRWLPQAKSLLRTLALALPLALAGFWLFPRLASPLWGMPNNASAKTGISDRMRPGQWLDLFTDDSPAFRVRFEGTPALPAELYWRGPVLWNFDGQEWTRSFMARNLPAGELQGTSSDIVQRIWLEPTEQRFLFALDIPRRIEGVDVLDYDRSGGLRERVTQQRSYRAVSTAQARFDAALPQTLRQMGTALPMDSNPRTIALARQWRSEGGDDAALVHRALQWFNREFSYSLDAPLLGRDGVDEFLFQHKIGYCEYFSSAFVVLMRAADIPARVVTGYAGGVYNPVGGHWLIRKSDAHAWAEVWLQGRGWVRVDPTAAVAPERVFETVEDLRNAESTEFFSLRNANDYRDWFGMLWNDWMLGFDAKRQQMLLSPFGKGDWQGVQSVVVIALGFAFALALSIWWLLRERAARRDELLRAWDAACARLAKLGLDRDSSETAEAYAQRVSIALGDAGARFRDLARAFNQQRYATDEVGTLAETIRRLRAFRPTQN